MQYVMSYDTSTYLTRLVDDDVDAVAAWIDKWHSVFIFSVVDITT